MNPPIYLDHHSTTPCDERVVEAMLPFFSETFGNPAAITHVHGRAASTALEEARSTIADFLRARTNEIYFTAGATESNNIALFGIASRGKHLVTTAIEHKSVLAPAKKLAERGIEITILQPDGEGFIKPDQLRAAIRDDTSLVSIVCANGEIGTIEPIAELGEVCRERGVAFHTDATQAVGKIEIDLSELPVDLLSLSAHKVYGPKGVGALYVRRGTRVEPLVVGGGQEKNLRSGTVNVPGAVGLAKALEIRSSEMRDEERRLTTLRNVLWDRIVREIPDTTVNGPRELRLPGNLNVSFARLQAEEIILSMRRFSLSSGSACASGDREPSPTLRAIGLDEARALSSIRFGLGKSNTDVHVDLLVGDLKTSVAKLREISVA